MCGLLWNKQLWKHPMNRSVRNEVVDAVNSAVKQIPRPVTVVDE